MTAQVYLIAGQSNALGRLLVSQYEGFEFNFTPDVPLDDYVAANGVTFVDALTADTPEDRIQDVFGPEYALSLALARAGQGPITIVKSALGGVRIDDTAGEYDWNWTAPRPTQAVDADSPMQEGQGLELFWKTVSVVEDALQVAGVSELSGLFWMQGEAHTQTLADAQAYESLLTDFLLTLDETLNPNGDELTLDLQTVIGEIAATSPRSSRFDGTEEVRRAQQAVANDLGATLLDTNDLPMNDSVHFSPTGSFRLGLETAQSFAAVPITTATEAEETVRAGATADIHDLLGGTDVFFGHSGSDVALGGAGNEKMYGRAGNDTLLGEDGADFMYGQDGDDLVYGGEDNDRIYGNDGEDFLIGENGADFLFGQDGTDRLYGGYGNDRMYGGNGGDLLAGEQGSDFLAGQAGDDILIAAFGVDQLVGGAGADTFVFDYRAGSNFGPSNGLNAALINDFDETEDRLVIRVAHENVEFNAQSGPVGDPASPALRESSPLTDGMILDEMMSTFTDSNGILWTLIRPFDGENDSVRLQGDYTHLDLVLNIPDSGADFYYQLVLEGLS